MERQMPDSEFIIIIKMRNLGYGLKPFAVDQNLALEWVLSHIRYCAATLSLVSDPPPLSRYRA